MWFDEKKRKVREGKYVLINQTVIGLLHGNYK